MSKAVIKYELLLLSETFEIKGRQLTKQIENIYAADDKATIKRLHKLCNDWIESYGQILELSEGIKNYILQVKLTSVNDTIVHIIRKGKERKGKERK